MPRKPVDLDGMIQPSNDVRDTIVKSGLSGVAATVLAVTIWSPAGLGGMIGTSLASGDSSSPVSDAVGGLAPFPAPITEVELRDIRAKLHDSAVSMRTLRESTNGEIAHIRAIARHANFASMAPMRAHAQVGAGMDVTDSIIAPAPIARVSIAPAADPVVAAAPAVEPNPLSVSYDAPGARLSEGGAVVTYIGGDEYNSAPDPNMELAALLLAL